MRIAIDCSHYAVPGGVRTYLDNLIWHLPREWAGVELTLYSRGRHRPVTTPRVPEGTRVRAVHARLPHRFVGGLEAALGWPAATRWTGPLDLFHGTHFSLPPTGGGQVEKVLTVHDLTYLRHPEYCRDRKLNDHGYGVLLPRALARADRVIALSQSGLRDLVELLDVDEERIWVIPHGLDPRFAPRSHEACAELVSRLGLRTPFALYPVGTIEPRKNLPSTLGAFAAAFPRPVQRPLLVLTGVGRMPAELPELLRQLGIHDDVRFLQVGYPEEVATLMSAARWGLYPSLYEGFGLPPLEALACGLPMIVSDRASCPEVVGDAALLVDPGDARALSVAMARLHDDDELRSELVRRGRSRAAHPGFGWRRAVRQTVACYRADRAAYRALTAPLVAPAEVITPQGDPL